MTPGLFQHHPFLRWYEALAVRLLVRSPRIEGLLVHSSQMPMAWVIRKTRSSQALEMLERTYANSPDSHPA